MVFEQITIGDATLIRGDSIVLLEQGFSQQFELGAIVRRHIGLGILITAKEFRAIKKDCSVQLA